MDKPEGTSIHGVPPLGVLEDVRLVARKDGLTKWAGEQHQPGHARHVQAGMFIRVPVAGPHVSSQQGQGRQGLLTGKAGVPAQVLQYPA